MTAVRADALRAVARYAQTVLTGAAGVGFAWSGVRTLSDAGTDVARTVLGAVLLVAAVVCAAGLYPVWAARPSAAGWGFTNATITAALAADVVFLDVARTPAAQPALDAVLATVALGEAAWAVSFLHLLAGRGRAGTLAGAALGLVGLLAAFMAWTGYLAAPDRARPSIRITSAFTRTRRVDDASGNLDHVTVTGTITVQNTGGRAAVVAGSLLDVVGHTSAPAATPIGADVAAGFETDIADAVDAAHALEPLGPNRHALSGFWPTSDQSLGLVELDEVLPGRTRLAPGANVTRRFSTDVPALVENPLTSITLDAEVVALDAAGPVSVHACAGERPAADGHLDLRTNRGHGGGFRTCLAAAAGALTPYGGLIDDQPGLRVSFVLGDAAVAGAGPGRLVVNRSAETSLPVTVAASTLDTEVSARADAGP